VISNFAGGSTDYGLYADSSWVVVSGTLFAGNGDATNY